MRGREACLSFECKGVYIDNKILAIKEAIRHNNFNRVAHNAVMAWGPAKPYVLGFLLIWEIVIWI